MAPELDLMKSSEVAKILRTSEKVLANQRHGRRGLRFIKLGSSVFYRRCDLMAYIESGVVETVDRRE